MPTHLPEHLPSLARGDLAGWFDQPTGLGCVAAAAVWNAREPGLALAPQEVCAAMRMGLPALGLKA